MGQIALQIPQVNLPDATEDPKIASDLTAIQTVINGNLDDSNLLSPNGAVRRLLLQASSLITPFAAGATNYVMLAGGGFIASTVGTAAPAPLWNGDAGLSSQPQDFQVAHKTAYARVRASIATNDIAPGTNVNVGIVQVSPTPGVGATQVAYTFGGMLASIVFPTPGANAMLGGESAQFALPSANTYALAFFCAGTPASQAAVSVTAQLYGYNA